MRSRGGDPGDVPLSDLFKLLLGLPHDAPVAATPSFGSWLNSASAVSWPPRADRPGGLLLVDTRDRAARRHSGAWSVGWSDTACFDAALVLTGSGQPGSPLRRALRRIRFPGTRRLPETHFHANLRAAGSGSVVYRLGFKDDVDVPAAFHLGDSATTGAAFLITRTPPFRGPLWSAVAQWLDSPDISVESLQLRVRGAAVVMVHAGERRFVLRVVPPCPLQEIVARNHSALMQLRESLADSDLLRLMPAPVFAERNGDVLVLGETLLEGKLAWRVRDHGLSSVIHDNAVAFLDRLRSATAQVTRLSQEQIRKLLSEDESLLHCSAFVSPLARDLLGRELRDAAAILNDTNVPLCTSHGDFGYGNLLVDENDGRLTGVIDWDTARCQDFPGIDRINLEVQTRRSRHRESFASAVESVWRLRTAHQAFQGEVGESSARALFGLAISRYIIRSCRYPAVYARESAGFERALRWLPRTGR